MHAVFARQKRKVFKGPTGLVGSPKNSNSRNITPTPGSERSNTGSRERSRQRQSVELVGSGAPPIVEEEDEEEHHVQHQPDGTLNAEGEEYLQTPSEGVQLDEDMDLDDVEEVEAFSPLSEGAVEVQDSAGADDGYFRMMHAAEMAKNSIKQTESAKGEQEEKELIGAPSAGSAGLSSIGESR